MNKKVIYLNSKTGKEVKYGEEITFEESGKFSNGYTFHSITTLPIINETIPDLIKKGILVQKEVKIEEEQNKKHEEMTVEKKLDILTSTIHKLIDDHEMFKEIIAIQTKILTELTKEVMKDY